MTAKEPLIVFDAGIPAAEAYLEGLGRTWGLPAESIDRAALGGANVLVVRSTARVDAALLEGTPVRFVGTATSGIDHVDRPWLRKMGISFAHARGANAESVVDYVMAALIRLAVRRGEPISGHTVGIIGCGNVGGRLARRLPHLGLRVLQRDPPRERRLLARSRPTPFVSMERILAESDRITLHTPLIRHGRDATHHLVDTEFIKSMRPGSWLLNTARGAVVAGAELREAWRGEGGLVLDVWEGEPSPDPELVAMADVATPHVAGYALDSKLEATRRMARAVARHLGRAWEPPPEAFPGLIPVDLPEPGLDGAAWLDALVRSMYPLERDDTALRQIVHSKDNETGRAFEALRREYPVRRLFRLHGIRRADVPEPLREAVFRGLGLGVLT